MSDRMPADQRVLRYTLTDQSLLKRRFTQAIACHTTRRLSDLYLSHVWEAFGANVGVGGAGLDRYSFSMMLQGTMCVYQGERETVARGSVGLVARPEPRTRLVTSDRSDRLNLWIEVQALDRTLAGLLGERPRQSLEFRSFIDWQSPLGVSLAAQIGYLLDEFRRPDGLADNPVASASFTDMILRTVLLSVPHNHSDLLANRRDDVGPDYYRRATDFMAAHAADPLRMADIAHAAGCSLRTLEAAFRRHGNTTPLAALQAIRLDRVRAELRAARSGLSTASIGRRYGFTNAARFAVAYGRRFGETPSETARAVANGVG